jgi:hypothetical protein
MRRMPKRRVVTSTKFRSSTLAAALKALVRTVTACVLAIIGVVGLAGYVTIIGLKLISSGVTSSETHGLVVLTLAPVIGFTLVLELLSRLKAIRR